MQELIGAFRQHALHIFRHRKGMLFVSPVRARPFQHGSASVSSSVAAILDALSANPGINRKQLLEKFQPNETGQIEGAEKKKLALASDLHWLISEGHVIEFNDGALDLARTKLSAPAKTGIPNGKVEAASPNESSADAAGPGAETASLAITEAAGPLAENELAATSEIRENKQPEAGEKVPAAD
jgi:hypothetical protein